MTFSKAVVALHRASVSAAFPFALPKGIQSPIGLLGLRGLRWKCGANPQICSCSNPGIHKEPQELWLQGWVEEPVPLVQTCRTPWRPVPCLHLARHLGSVGGCLAS